MRSKRNPVAKALRTSMFKMQVVKDRSKYERKDKFKKDLNHYNDS